jgi:hypothetical protein
MSAAVVGNPGLEKRRGELTSPFRSRRAVMLMGSVNSIEFCAVQ